MGPHEPGPSGRGRGGGPTYAELHCHSNASFLDGGSHPEELAEEAARLRLEALAVTDHDGMYGIVRFAEAAKGALPSHRVREAEPSPDALRRPGGRGGEDRDPDPAGEHTVVLARGPEGYARLCRAISEAQMAGAKGRPGGTWGGWRGCTAGTGRC